MRINNLTLKMRLIITITIPCLALIFVGLSSLRTMTTMQLQSQTLYSNTAAPMRAMAEAASRIPRMRVGIDMMLLQETSLKDERGVLSRIKDARTEDIPEMRQAMQFAVDAQVNPELKNKAKDLLQQFDVMVSNELNPMLDAFENGDINLAKDIYRNKYAKTYGVMRKSANEIISVLLEQAESQNQKSVTSYEEGRTRQIMIIGLALIISFITSTIIVINLRNRVSLLKDTMGNAAQTLSLKTRVTLDGKDELIDIGDSFNQFIEKVHNSISEVANNSRKLAQMAHSVAARASQTQNNCTSQRDRTVQVATAIHELGATVNEIASNASNAASVAREATLCSAEGSDVVNQAQQQITELTEELERSTAVVESLAGQIDNISSTLGTIRSISEQTNLLALNAAIEAARAGEQGRGFAVVADEVRTLASRSANSTEEIQQVINQLQAESKRAVEAMGAGRHKSEKVVEYADKAKNSLQQINAYIDQISDQNIQVATATEEQSSVVEDINRNVGEINHLTMETTEIAEQLSESSASLQRLSAELDKLVNYFQL